MMNETWNAVFAAQFVAQVEAVYIKTTKSTEAPFGATREDIADNCRDTFTNTAISVADIALDVLRFRGKSTYKKP